MFYFSSLFSFGLNILVAPVSHMGREAECRLGPTL